MGKSVARQLIESHLVGGKRRQPSGLGATTSVFPSDDVMRAFLQAQGRENAWCEITADGSSYDLYDEIDLSGCPTVLASRFIIGIWRK